MSIKERIGKRIEEQRKFFGYTRKELAALTDGLKQSRISNWELGTRTPGPEEIKQLAKILNVSPAYLMCLTDDKHVNTIDNIPGLGCVIPILDHNQACNPIEYLQSINDNQDNTLSFFPISSDFAEHIGKYAFALKVQDASMEPEFNINDILIIDPEVDPKPGDCIIVKLKEQEEIIIRRYKQLSVEKKFQHFELLPTNENWAKITVSDSNSKLIIGLVCALFRITLTKI